ncbi:protease SohB [Thorsellia kenyensis]|uniref:Protease SohB n=1 Tax=Thorsellia kenyensis TaxID=1549888 RepID=A0ABV6C7G1_9GAMM
MEYLVQYGVFLAQTITIVAAIAVILILIVGMRHKSQGQKGEIQVISLSEKHEETVQMMQGALMNPAEQKMWQKKQKQEERIKRKKEKIAAKQEHKEGAELPHLISTDATSVSNEQSKSKESQKKLESDQSTVTSESKTAIDDNNHKRIFVIDFDGSMDAGEVSSLREEITAILSVAKSQDTVIIRLTSPGGVVHGYGLAASQLARIKNANINLVACVDKVAASGGYMMACVADKIIAAPFAILGSIGVVAQVPNFNRFLKKNEIDVELHTAGAYKRTLTLFGENTEEGREKFRQELNETHELFKRFVIEKRPSLDIESVATGEHWYGIQALEKGLVDEIATSDDYLGKLYQDHKVLKIKYVMKKRMAERVTRSASKAIIDSVMSIWQNNQKPQI